MTPLSTVIGQLVALFAYLVVVAASPRIAIVQRWRPHLTVLLAVVAVAAWMDFGRLHPGRVWVHWWDTYHYVMGSKYFAELGYDGLYEATVIADAEDDPPSLVHQIPVRSLRTYELETRGTIAARATAVRARFSAERWQEFKRDIASYRQVDLLQWRNSAVLVDHGFNGTPTLAALIGAVANHSGLDARTLAIALAYSDPLLLLALALLVGRRYGAEAGALLVLVWAANPLNDFQVIGGAPFRSLHVLLLAGGAMTLHSGHHRLSGALAGLATSIRILPGAVAAAVVTWAMVGRAGQHREQRVARWVLAALLALSLATAAGATQRAPDGRMAWLPFVEKVTMHGDKLSPNVISLRYPFFYDDSHNARAVEASWPNGERLNWVAESTRTLASRWHLYQTAVALFAAAAFLLLRRGDWSDAWWIGIVTPFLVLAPSHYEGSVLSVVVLIVFQNRPALLLSLGALIACGSLRLIPALEQVLDRRFLAQSIAVSLWIAGLLALRLVQSRRSQGSRTGT